MHLRNFSGHFCPKSSLNSDPDTAPYTILSIFHSIVVSSTYLTPPSVGRDVVDGWLQAEGVVAFVTHVTHQHLIVLPWVPAHREKDTYSLALWTLYIAPCALILETNDCCKVTAKGSMCWSNLYCRADLNLSRTRLLTVTRLFEVRDERAVSEGTLPTNHSGSTNKNHTVSTSMPDDHRHTHLNTGPGQVCGWTDGAVGR